MSFPALLIHRTNRDKTSGFTLVELMISVAVIGILAGMAAQVFTVLLDAREAAMKRIEISETASAALDYMASDIRAAYLTPDSVRPRIELSDPQPRFRFLGISRDILIKNLKPEFLVEVPGYKSTNKGVLDGVNYIYDPVESYFSANPNPTKDPDCEDNDLSCADSNIAIFPSDLLHFVNVVDNGSEVIFQEISYGLNPPGTKLIRRSQMIKLVKDSNPVNFGNFGQFIDNTTQKHLVPPAIPINGSITPNDVNQFTAIWDDGSEYGTLSSKSTNLDKKFVDRTFEILAYDIRGLRFTFWYYDYNRGGWRFANEWDSARETALIPMGNYLFNKPAISSSREGYTRGGAGDFHSIIANEPDDMYPRVDGIGTNFLVKSPADLLNNLLSSQSEFYQTARRVAAQTDGLPNMVEITIYVQDRDHTVNPKRFQSRVFIPNNFSKFGL